MFRTFGEFNCGRIGARLSCIDSTEAFRGCDVSNKDARSAREEEFGAVCARRKGTESRGSKTVRESRG